MIRSSRLFPLRNRSARRSGSPMRPLLGLGAVVGLGYAYYSRSFRYRDPVRLLPAEAGLVAPVDGRVEQISAHSGGWQLTLRLSSLSVRYIYAPADAQVGRLVQESEGSGPLEFSFDDGLTVSLGEVGAPLGARSYFAAGDAVRRGNKLAFLERGTVVRLSFSGSLRPVVTVGKQVVGGQTIVAQTKH